MGEVFVVMVLKMTLSCGYGVEEVFISQGWRGSGHPPASAHGASATRTQDITAGDRFGLRGWLEPGFEQQLEPLQAGFATRVKESPVADAVKPIRQHVKKEPAYELDTVEDCGAIGLGIPVFDTDTDLISFYGQYAVIGDDAAADVLAEILDGVLPVPGPVDIGIPVDLDQLPEQIVPVRRLDLVQTSELLPQHPPVEVLRRRQKLAATLRRPLAVTPQIHEKPAQVLLSQNLRILPEVLPDHPQSAVIARCGALTKILQLQILRKTKH